MRYQPMIRNRVSYPTHKRRLYRKLNRILRCAGSNWPALAASAQAEVQYRVRSTALRYALRNQIREEMA